MNNMETFNESTVNSLDDLIKILTRDNKTTRTSDFLWSKVPNSVQKDLLYKISHELGFVNPRFISSKNLEKHKFKFLNNTALNGLYSYYKNRSPRKPGVHVLTNVCDFLNIDPPTSEDWIIYIQKNNLFSWKTIPLQTQREILLRASFELGYNHPIFINNDDFNKKFKFLGNKSLSGFYAHFIKTNNSIRGSAIKNMCIAFNIPIDETVWLEYITNDKINTFWDVIPKEVVGKLLMKAANSLGYSNPRMISSRAMKKDLQFLNGLSLYSFISRFFKINRNGLRSMDYICDAYNIPKLTYEDWIFMIRNFSNVRWQHIPHQYIGKILTERALELGKSNPRMLKYDDLKAKSNFLKGKNLSSLYSYYGKLKGHDEFQIINYMCNITGIDELTSEEWLQVLTDTNKIFWELVPKEVIKSLLFMASEELELKNPRLMGYNDFCNTRFSFFKEKTLSGFYYHMSTKISGDYYNISNYIFDYVELEKLNLEDWISLIANTAVCRWESIPTRVQRNILIKASQEMGKNHPRLMVSRDFYSFRLSFLNYKTLSGFLQYYSNLIEDKNEKITDFIFDKLNIPKIDINIKTGRLATIDSSKHKKYYDSIANLKDFINSYLNLYSLESLCKKNTAIKNAKASGIYKKGLVTILAPLNKETYLDFIYELLKTVPRDTLGLRKLPNKPYKLYREDLFALAKIKESSFTEKLKINFAKPELMDETNIYDVINWLKRYSEILHIRNNFFNSVPCKIKSKFGNNLLFYTTVPFSTNDIITDSHQWEFQVLECGENKNIDGYTIELKPLFPLDDSQIPLIQCFNKGSNDVILYEFLNSIIEDIIKGSLSNLMSIALGLRKQITIDENKITFLKDEAYFNQTILKNEAQKQAVSLACSLDGKDNTLAIVQGPPGTGKTTLIKEIALQYYNRGKNVLILAKTNIAVDNVFEKIVEDKVRVLRTGNNIQEKSSLSFAPMLSTSNPLYMASLVNKNIIAVGTPLGFYFDNNIEDLPYDIVIMDEASQLDVAETLFAMQFADNCVMIGDHLQIPPFPIQEDVLLKYDPNIDLATRENLQQSLFEKLITDKNRFNHVFLDINYRTENPELVSLISNLIYDGQLSPNLDSQYYLLPENKRKKLFPKEAIDIVDTSKIIDYEARMETEINSTYYNLSEAMLSVRKVTELLRQGERLEKICIITPYKAHAEKLKEVFEANAKYFASIMQSFEKFIENNIYTIDSFQGREQDNVIINWVRSNYTTSDARTQTGFLRDYRRVNVAISRARKRLILIGDFKTLLNSDNLKVRYIFNKLYNFNKKKRIVL